jgi:hypothetical protein
MPSPDDKPRVSGFMIAMVLLFFVALAAAILSAFYRSERATKAPVANPSAEQRGGSPPAAPAREQ